MLQELIKISIIFINPNNVSGLDEIESLIRFEPGLLGLNLPLSRHGFPLGIGGFSARIFGL